MKKTPAWTRTEGKAKSGGLNEKGRKSYDGECAGLFQYRCKRGASGGGWHRPWD